MIVDVIIPVLNEEASITKVISEIPKNLIRHIYVCDNGSTDLSREKAKSAGAIVLLENKRGYGAACYRGIQQIASKPEADYPDIVVFIDGDYADRPVEMIAMLENMKSENLDLIIGSRVLGNREPGSLTIVQEFGNKLSCSLIKLLFSYQYSDLGPFRAIRFKKLLNLNMQDRGYGWTVEMQAKAAKLKMRIGEMPVSYHRRIGKSKISGTIKGVLGAGSKILYTIFKTFVKG